MKKYRRKSSTFFDFTLIAGLLLVWIAFAPAKIGGKASYVMVNGISMEPSFHSGDLVIVRKALTYQVGDVVTYRDAGMNAYVIHRVISVGHGEYELQGDNNTWIDAYHPTNDEIVGKLWIHAPGLGNAVHWLRTPVNLALSTSLLGGAFMTSMIIQPSQHKKGKNKPSTNFGGLLEGTLYLLGFLFLAFLGLGIFSFTRPLMRTADNVQYQQESNFFYSATGTLGVYDTELVRSGEPVFPKLTCFLNIGFTHNILGSQLQQTTGIHQLNARIMDEQSGWQRTIPLIPQTAFSGNSFFTMATLDLCQMESLVNTMEQETGLHANSYNLEIISNIAFTANVAGQAISDTFDPSLVFKFDKVHLYLANNNAQENPLHLTKQGLAGSTGLEANTISLPGWKPSVPTVRLLSLFGLGLAMSGFVMVGLHVFNAARQSQEALIRLRYGSLLVDVYERSIEPTSTLIDVTTMDDLAKLAERHNTMILHMTLNFLQYYLVQCNGTTYRYLISTGRNGVAEIEPARQEVVGYVVGNDDYGFGESLSSREAIPAYVINTDRTNAKRMDFAQTEILRKIKF